MRSLLLSGILLFCVFFCAEATEQEIEKLRLEGYIVESDNCSLMHRYIAGSNFEKVKNINLTSLASTMDFVVSFSNPLRENGSIYYLDLTPFINYLFENIFNLVRDHYDVFPHDRYFALILYFLRQSLGDGNRKELETFLRDKEFSVEFERRVKNPYTYSSIPPSLEKKGDELLMFWHINEYLNILQFHILAFDLIRRNQYEQLKNCLEGRIRIYAIKIDYILRHNPQFHSEQSVVKYLADPEIRKIRAQLKK